MAGQARMARENQEWQRLADFSQQAGLAGSTQAILEVFLNESARPLGFESALLLWQEDEALAIDAVCTHGAGEGVAGDNDGFDLGSFDLTGIGTLREPDLGLAEARRRGEPVMAGPRVGPAGTTLPQEQVLLKALGAQQGMWLSIDGNGSQGGLLLVSQRKPDPQATSNPDQAIAFWAGPWD